MYQTLKGKAKALISKKTLIRNEEFIRSIYGTLYKGNKHECNICNKRLRKFITLENNDLLCPFCGSLSRTRRLWYLLNINKAVTGNILHFSPPRSLYRKLKKNKAVNYFSSDFEDEFLADYNFDITKINQPEHTFDLIICYHILEHVIDDKKAMDELYRVLKPSGLIYIQTPFKTGEIYEDFSVTSSEERKLHFGQQDHVRIYSSDGLTNRLENTGFKVNTKSFSKKESDFYNGFKSPEIVLVAKK